MVQSLLLGDERVDKIEMSKVSNKHSVGVARQTQASCFDKGGRSGSESSSSGECEDKVLAHKAQWATQTELRELRDKVKWFEGERRKQWVQGKPTCADGTSGECEKLEVDEEFDSKKKSDQRKKELVLQLRRIGEFPDMPQKDGRRAQRIMAGRAAKISSKDGMIFCQSIKRCRRDHKHCRVYRTERNSARRAWASGLKTMSGSGTSWKKRMPKMEEHGQTIQKESVAEAELDEEIRGVQAGGERRGSSAAQAHGCCFDAGLSHQRKAMQQLSVLHGELSNTKVPQGKVEEEGGEGNEEEQRRRAASREHGHQCQGAAMEGFLLVLFLILLHLQGRHVKAMETSLVHLEKEMEVEADRFARQSW